MASITRCIFFISMNKILLFCIYSVALIFPFEASPRTSINMNRNWLFSRSDTINAWQKYFNDSAWETVHLPHDFQISQPWVQPGTDEKADMTNPVANVKSRLSARGFKESGVGWYRKKFKADPSWRGKRIILDFEGIMLNGDVWVNGEKAGSTDYGYLGFESDITNIIDWDKENIIVVRADTGKPENSRWYTGGGLYRDVKIIVTDQELYFTRHPLYITTPDVTKEEATVFLQTEIANFTGTIDSITLKTAISDNDGKVIYEKVYRLPFNSKQKLKEYLVDSIKIRNPRLWSVETPHLYTVTCDILDSLGYSKDHTASHFGIRKIEYSPDFGLLINGEKVLLKGIANHHTLGALGAAAFPAAMKKRLRLLKEFGFNHVRTSHNPYSESFLNLCDELGILVVDELYDKWLTQYAGGRKDWTEQWQKDVPEWVKRDRNHPSVIMWSLGNELQLLWDIPYADWGVTPYRLQKTLLNRFDTTRPVTVAMHPRGRSETTDSIPAPLALETDIAAYNYRYMYFPGDSRRYPWMIFYQSEANTSNMGPNFFDMDLDKVVGLAYWGMIDYLGESNGWPAKGWTQGVFNIDLSPKPNAWFLKSYFKPEEPLVHLAVVEDVPYSVWNDVKMGGQKLTENWNHPDGKRLSVYTYTNADEVELFVNGKSLGRKVNNRDNSIIRNRIRWDSISFSPGKIEAKAFNHDKPNPVATHSLETAGEAVKITAYVDNSNWKADGMDLQHIKFQAVDSKNLPVKTEDSLLNFFVEGPAEIIGVINGDMSSMESFTSHSRSLYNGEATLILRSLPEQGDVVISVSSPKFKTKKLRMKTLKADL